MTESTNSKNELLTFKNQSAMTVYASQDGLAEFIHLALEEVEGFEHDMKTAASRQRTKSLARKVGSLSIRLDSIGKDLTSEWKEKSKVVDANRKSMRDQLKLIKEKAREPLDIWEAEKQAEKDAKEKIKAEKEISLSHEMAILMNSNIDREREEERISQLKKEAEEKEVNDQRIRDLAIEQAKIDADNVKKETAQREADYLAKIEEGKQREIQAQQREEQRIINYNLQVDQAIKQAEIDAENTRIEKEQQVIDHQNQIAKAAEDARQRAIKEQQQQKEQAEAEAEKRKQNQAHIAKICGGAKNALIQELGIDEPLARSMVIALRDGRITNATLNF